EVAHRPTLLAQINFGVAAADRGVAQNDFKVWGATDAKGLIGFPNLAFERGTDAVQADSLLGHAYNPLGFTLGDNTPGLRVHIMCQTQRRLRFRPSTKKTGKNRPKPSATLEKRVGPSARLSFQVYHGSSSF